MSGRICQINDIGCGLPNGKLYHRYNRSRLVETFISYRGPTALAAYGRWHSRAS